MKSGSQSVTLTQSSSQPSHEKIALRAFTRWLARGCPEGDPDTDWHAAFQELISELDQQPSDQQPSDEPPRNRYAFARRTVPTVDPPTAWWAVYGKLDRDGFPHRLSERESPVAVG